MAGLHGEAVKLRVTAAPRGGAANTEAERALADLVGVRPRSVAVVGGQRSRDKVLHVDGVTAAEVVNRLNAS